MRVDLPGGKAVSAVAALPPDHRPGRTAAVILAHGVSMATIAGVPTDGQGFIPTDDHGRVHGDGPAGFSASSRSNDNSFLRLKQVDWSLQRIWYMIRERPRTLLGEIAEAIRETGIERNKEPSKREAQS